MRKVLIGLAIAVVLLVVAIAIVPMFFKDRVKNEALKYANESLKGEMYIGDVDLSLISTFPDLKIVFEETRLTGEDEFENIDLMSIQEIILVVDLLELFDGQFIIREMGVSNGKVNVVVMKNGLANYDIAAVSEDATEEASVEEAQKEDPISIQVDRYYLKDLDIRYSDHKGGMLMEILQLYHEGEGKFSTEEFLLKTSTQIEEMTFEMEGLKYLNKVTLKSDLDLLVNLVESKYVIDTSFVSLNALSLFLDGSVIMPDEQMFLDLNFGTNQTSITQILSLIPAVYMADFQNIDAHGAFKLNGFVKGEYASEDGGEVYPAFEINSSISDGNFGYPDLPARADNLEMDLKINHPGGVLDRMVIDLKNLEAKMAGNAFSASIYVEQPMSKMLSKGSLKLDFDISTVPEFIPVEKSEEYQGKIIADLKFDAALAEMEQGAYDKAEFSGFIDATSISVSGNDLPPGLGIDHMRMEFNQNKVSLEDMRFRTPRTQMSMSGSLSNFIPWYMADKELLADLSFSADTIYATDWMGEESSNSNRTEEAQDTAQSMTEPLEDPEWVPNNINATTRASINRLNYENYDLNNIQSKIRVEGGKVVIETMKADMFEGNSSISGVLEPYSEGKAPYQIDINANYWKLNKVVKTVETLERMAPILNSATGLISTKMALNGSLDRSMEPILDELHFNGRLKSQSIGLDNDKLDELARITKVDKLSSLQLNDIDVSYSFKNGKLITEPTTFRLNGNDAAFNGYTTLDQEINYDIETEMPTSDLGESVASGAEQLSSFLSAYGVEGAIPETIPLGVKITGTVDNPKFVPRLGDISGSASQSTKEAVREKVEKEIEMQKERGKEEARKQAQKIIADARKEKEKLVKEAQRRADQLKKEARKQAGNLRSEADKQAKKLEEEAANPIQQMTAKAAGDVLRKEADKKANDLVKEADKQAEKLVKQAEKQGDKLINDAEKKAEESIESR
ncbi:MAG TPA: hypothetical protein DDX92_01650 [Flavobacteriales bacterium]|jgi:cell division septum initiation protein DivIVA|nr:hypothetical protein [Flavobacteriales bacterium]